MGEPTLQKVFLQIKAKSSYRKSLKMLTFKDIKSLPNLDKKNKQHYEN